MTDIPRARTALLFVDPYNDFFAEGGKLWPFIQEVAQAVGLHAHLRALLAAVRAAGLPVFVVPHHRWEPGDFERWEFPSPDQRRAAQRQSFAKGTWGGEWYPDFAPQPGDVIAHEHWAQNGFANTDLALLLNQHGIRRVLVVGLLANTCIESTARHAMELGFHVTLVTDATAAMSLERMHAAHVLNGPNYAHAILTTDEAIATLTSPGS